MQRLLFVALLCLMSPLTAAAQTVINDGGTHSVATTSGPIKVLDGSTLLIEPGAAITGNASIGSYGVYGDPTSTIQLLGGSVVGPAPLGNNNGDGIETLGAFTASGGSATGEGTTSTTVVAGFGLVAGGSVSISGGTFTGGSGPSAGFGAYLGAGPGVSISGGMFIGGNSSGQGAGGALGLSESGASTITAGIFTGGSSNGGGTGNALVYQGLGGASLEVAGGTYTGAIDFDLATYGANSLYFLGSGFSLSDLAGTYTLTGTLADGTPLDVTLISHSGDYTYWVDAGAGGFEEFGFGVNIGVPEPSTWVLMGLGVMGMAAAGKRRPRRVLDRSEHWPSFER